MKLRWIFILGFVLFGTGMIAFRYLPYFQNPVNQLETPLIQIDTSVVSAVSITFGGQELQLIRELQQWIVTDGLISGGVRDSALRPLLNVLHELNAFGIVAQEEASWAGYGLLDQQAIEVQVFIGNRPVQHFFVSRERPSAGTSEDLFFRFVNYPQVYAISREKGSLFQKPMEYYRRRQLLRLNTDRLTGFSMNWDSLTFYWNQLVTADSGQTAVVVDSALISAWFETVKELDGNAFADAFDEVQSASQRIGHLELQLESLPPVLIDCYRDTSTYKETPFIIYSSQYPKHFFRTDSSGIFRQLFLPFLRYERN